MKRDKIACNCHNVSYGKIIDCVKGGAHTYEEVRDQTGAGKGCGKCRDFITTMIRDILRFPADYE